jgi:NAD-dependent isocitrate dehydrogenase
MKHQAVLIPGDGIGPEITEAVTRIIAASGVDFEWTHVDAGLGAIAKHGVSMTDDGLERIATARLALKGPTTTPVGGGHSSVNVLIRKALGLFANVRMARSIPGIETRYNDVDLLIVRENVEDTYGGIEYMQTPDVALSYKFISRPGTEAVSRYAFEYARQLGRKKVTCVHKANIHKMSDGLFLKVFREVADMYPDIEANDIIVDNCCMQLVTKPEQFDVMVLPNLYGDIVSDLCAGLIGGLGIAPGSNIGHDVAIFEAVHGSAPDIAGRNIANPTALLQSAIHMLRYLGETVAAGSIESALFATLAAGEKTRDLGGTLGTREFADAVITRVAAVDPNRVPQTPSLIQTECTTRETVDRKLVGVDVYVKFDGIPPRPDRAGKFKCQGAANRGVKIDAATADRADLIDWWRLRYVSDEAVNDRDIAELLASLDPAAEWMHLQKLYTYNGLAAYAK